MSAYLLNPVSGCCQTYQMMTAIMVKWTNRTPTSARGMSKKADISLQMVVRPRYKANVFIVVVVGRALQYYTFCEEMKTLFVDCWHSRA